MPKKTGARGLSQSSGLSQSKGTKKSRGVIEAILKGTDAGDFYQIASRVPHLKKEDITAPEGQLSVDVSSTENEIVVVATLAGTKPDDIEIAVAKDMLTIRGRRQKPVQVEGGAQYLSECFWGNFSRTIILPQDVNTNDVRALFRNGILIVTLPKEQAGLPVPIVVVDE